VDKVVELLEQCKAKVQKDLAAEGKAMEEYATFCDEQNTDKSFAIETSEREILELESSIEQAKATISSLEGEIAEVGNLIAEKEGAAYSAKTERDAAHESFIASEKEMITSVEEMGRAVSVFKNLGGASLLQTDKPKIQALIKSVSMVIEANHMNTFAVDSKNKLGSFLQAAQQAVAKKTSAGEKSDGDDDLDFDKAMAAPSKQTALVQEGEAEDTLAAPAAAAFESQTGGILKTLEDMEEKAQDTLSDLRKKEVEDQMSYELIDNGLKNELTHANEKKDLATSNKAASTQSLEEANGKLVDTQNSKLADEKYLATLKIECQTKAKEWEERQKSATEEMAAIDKAKDILVSGVKVLMQTSSSTRVAKWGEEALPAPGSDRAVREKLGEKLKALSRKYHSFALNQLALRSKSDPFVKIRGLIEDMIAKLMKEAEEEATHEAFCQEEMGKTKKSKEDKEGKVEKFKTRIDTAETSIAELAAAIQELTNEIGVIDKEQAEATSIRQAQNEEYKKSSSDYKQSADAVARAIEVLKSYYEGAFIQVAESRSTKTLAAQRARARQPSFGGNSGDTAHTIIGILEVAQEDFTSLLAEVESDEEEAAKAYAKLSDENKISKATKQMEIKTKESEVKSLQVQLENSKEDHAGVKEELDAVLSYLDKLKPECESKAMSYEEKKAAREQEVEGLKNALEILENKDMALVQTGRHLRSARRI